MAKPKFSEGLFDVQPILKALNVCKGQTILDAGCGNGYMAKRFSELVGNTGIVYAMDTEKSSIDNLKDETQKANIKALVGDITGTTEFEDSSIDLVYLSTVFHIFSDGQVRGFDKEVERLLKPNAQLAILNIHKKETPFGPSLAIRSSPEELRQKISLTPKKLLEVGDYFYMQMFVNI